MGGGPLLEFDIMKQLVPFGIRRMAEHGKKLSFGMTTNCTLFSDDVAAFCQEWGVVGTYIY